jgi:hypothetical protein
MAATNGKIPPEESGPTKVLRLFLSVKRSEEEARAKLSPQRYYFQDLILRKTMKEAPYRRTYGTPASLRSDIFYPYVRP